MQMAKFYETKEFQKLKADWYERLEAFEFQDIERKNESLRSHNDRTQNFKDREQVLSFFLAFDSYLTNTRGIPRKHRRILKLYTSGLKIIRIAERMNCHRNTCHKIIKQYKRLFLYK